jgi:hypothetical protein
MRAHAVPIAVVKVPDDRVIAFFAQLPADLVALNCDARRAGQPV